jgi:hypothetical protein
VTDALADGELGGAGGVVMEAVPLLVGEASGAAEGVAVQAVAASRRSPPAAAHLPGTGMLRAYVDPAPCLRG